MITLTMVTVFSILYWYILNGIDNWWFVYSILIKIYIYNSFYLNTFDLLLKISERVLEYLQQKHGVMAVKRQMIHNLVWQNLVPTNWRDINKLTNICLIKYMYFRLIGVTYLWESTSIYGSLKSHTPCNLTCFWLSHRIICSDWRTSAPVVYS